MNTSEQHALNKRWVFTLVLVAALVAAALLSTVIANAVTDGQAIDQLRSYYVYLPIVFHR